MDKHFKAKSLSMDKYIRAKPLSMAKYFRAKSLSAIIIAVCIFIICVLVASLFFANFTNFRNGARGAVSAQTRELSTQIVYNYENYIGGIIATSNIIQADIDNYGIHTESGRAAFSNYLRDITRFKADVISIAVYDYVSRACVASSNAEDAGRRFDESGAAWFFEAVADPTVHVFSAPFPNPADGEYRVNVSKRVKFRDGSAAGVLKIEISFQSFIELVGKSNLGPYGHITIVGPGYGVIYSSSPGAARAEDEIAIVRDIVLGARDVRIGGHNMAVNIDTLTGTKWRICVFINIDRLAAIEREFLITTLLISGCVILVGALLLTGVARMITRPMKRLEIAMLNVEQSDYFRMEEVDIAAFREIDALIERFNKMMRKINELMKRVIDEQDAQRKSELKALQNQINPHFLYNTLDSIVWLIENEKNREAAELVVALAKLFRIGISGGSEVITVRDELEHVRNYLLIQNIRYAGAFGYEFEVDESVLDLPAVKLTLQPIVENCIYHGLKNNIDKGMIKISAYAENGSLVLKVADNGYGMRREAVEELYASFDGAGAGSGMGAGSGGAGGNAGASGSGTGAGSGVGLKNIWRRMMIYHQGKAEIIIESELDEGTSVTIKTPITQTQ